MLCVNVGMFAVVVTMVAGLAIGLNVNRSFRGRHALDYAPLIDGHNDLPFNIYEKLNNKLEDFPFEKNLTDDPTWGRSGCRSCFTDLPRLVAGKVGGQFWVAYTDCKSQYKDSVQLTLRQIDVIKRLVKKYPEHLELVTSASEIEPAWHSGKIASMIAVEGGHSMDSSLAVLRLYHELGVRYMTLTHVCNTPWADASPVEDKPVYRLTEFGRAVVLEMNRLGIMVDLSHVSHDVMRDVLQVSKAPVIFSHSSAFSLCRNYRNVPDDVLFSLKRNQGVVMVNFYSGFVNCDKTRNATLQDVADHINYIKNLIGVEHVGIGADYDGVDSLPRGLEDVSKFPDLFDHLYDNRNNETSWTRTELEQLAGRNLIRVFSAVERVRNSLVSESPREDIISGTELQQAQAKAGLNPGKCQSAIEWNNLFKNSYESRVVEAEDATP
ncbi:dipeptidase 1-like isoform X2 [Venturia canescens]|nr:dipeptidase 1-like isoform X2 [Venturia canescens]